ncbi:collagen, type I, alpha 1a-like [Prinia subflava]|uniref:collagen, type I, alpha 1a-like n=1 Tax=Prinia subflava TaxID=208062 RepID=UPI002FE07777
MAPPGCLPRCRHRGSVRRRGRARHPPPPPRSPSRGPGFPSAARRCAREDRRGSDRPAGAGTRPGRREPRAPHREATADDGARIATAAAAPTPAAVRARLAPGKSAARNARRARPSRFPRHASPPSPLREGPEEPPPPSPEGLPAALSLAIRHRPPARRRPDGRPSPDEQKEPGKGRESAFGRGGAEHPSLPHTVGPHAAYERAGPRENSGRAQARAPTRARKPATGVRRRRPQSGEARGRPPHPAKPARTDRRRIGAGGVESEERGVRRAPASLSLGPAARGTARAGGPADGRRRAPSRERACGPPVVPAEAGVGGPSERTDRGRVSDAARGPGRAARAPRQAPAPTGAHRRADRPARRATALPTLTAPASFAGSDPRERHRGRDGGGTAATAAAGGDRPRHSTARRRLGRGTAPRRGASPPHPPRGGEAGGRPRRRPTPAAGPSRDAAGKEPGPLRSFGFGQRGPASSRVPVFSPFFFLSRLSGRPAPPFPNHLRRLGLALESHNARGARNGVRLGLTRPRGRPPARRPVTGERDRPPARLGRREPPARGASPLRHVPPPGRAESTGRARGDSDPTRRARPGHRGPSAGAARSAAGGSATKEHLTQPGTVKTPPRQREGRHLACDGKRIGKETALPEHPTLPAAARRATKAQRRPRSWDNSNGCPAGKAGNPAPRSCASNKSGTRPRETPTRPRPPAPAARQRHPLHSPVTAEEERGGCRHPPAAADGGFLSETTAGRDRLATAHNLRLQGPTTPRFCRTRLSVPRLRATSKKKVRESRPGGRPPLRPHTRLEEADLLERTPARRQPRQPGQARHHRPPPASWLFRAGRDRRARRRRLAHDISQGSLSGSSPQRLGRAGHRGRPPAPRECARYAGPRLRAEEGGRLQRHPAAGRAGRGAATPSPTQPQRATPVTEPLEQPEKGRGKAARPTERPRGTPGTRNTRWANKSGGAGNEAPPPRPTGPSSGILGESGGHQAEGPGTHPAHPRL